MFISMPCLDLCVRMKTSPLSTDTFEIYLKASIFTLLGYPTGFRFYFCAEGICQLFALSFRKGLESLLLPVTFLYRYFCFNTKREYFCHM